MAQTNFKLSRVNRYFGITIFAAILITFIFSGCKSNTTNSITTENDSLSILNDSKESVVGKVNPPKDEVKKEGGWKFDHYHDEFGEELKDEPYIIMSLEAHKVSQKHDDEYITIGYSKNSEVEYFAFQNSELIYKVRPGEKEGPLVSIKKDGEIQELEIVKGRGFAYIFDEWERRSFADLLEEGHFILKVGNYLVEITDQTKGFKEALKQLGEVEILEPAFTREDPSY